MMNRHALATHERPGLFSVSFENPEVAAMNAICELLQALPDDAARLRVMHWSFGRFAPEFKRPVGGSAPSPAVAVAAPEPPPVREAVQPAARAIAAAAIEARPSEPAVAPADPPVAREDMGAQISELQDLFPGRPASGASDPALDVRGL